MTLQNRFKQKIEQIFICQDSVNNFPKKIAIAVSGGIDSMALAFLTKEISKNTETQIICLIVDHKLRKISTKHAKITAKTLENHNISCEILTSYLKKAPKSNIEANLREVRYNLLTRFCIENKIKYLFVGHHEQDIAENFLIRLFRGSGIDGLASLDYVNDFQDIKLIRPLLDFKKAELEDYLVKNNINWVEDESNDDEKYLRNKIRNFLNSLSEKDLINQRISLASRSILESKKIIEEKLINNAHKILEFNEMGYFLLKKPEFCELNEEEAKRYLAWILMEIGGNYYKPRLKFLENLYFSILEKKEFTKRCFYGCMIDNYSDNQLIIYREKAKIYSKVLENNMIWDDRFKIEFKGDILEKINVININASSFNKLKIDHKIKGILKNILYTIPVFEKNEEILAIPHLNYYLNDDLREIIIKFHAKTSLCNTIHHN